MILAIILILTLFFQTVLYLTRPVVTLYASSLGASTFEIGVLTALFSFIPVLLAVHAGKIADKVGDRLPIIVGFLISAFGLFVPFYFDSIWALYASQILFGIANVIVVLSLQNSLGNNTTKDTRDFAYSMFSLCVATGVFIGPMLGGYITEHYSYSAAFFVSMLLCLIAILFSIKIPVVLKKQQKEKKGIFSSVGLLKIPLLRNAIFASALVLYTRDIYIAYFPLFGKEMNLSESEIGWILAAQGFAMIIVRMFLTKLTAWLTREKVMYLSILLAGIAFIIMPFTNSFVLLLFLSCLIGFGLGCGQPISLTVTFNVSPKDQTGEVLGLRLTVNRLSQLIAPLFFGSIGSLVGIASVFYISGACLTGGALFVRKGTERERMKEDKVV